MSRTRIAGHARYTREGLPSSNPNTICAPARHRLEQVGGELQ